MINSRFDLQVCLNIDDGGKAILIDWLHRHEVKRYAESIAILEGLIERNHVNMHYQCELITAYHQTGRGEQRSELMNETIALFRRGGAGTSRTSRNSPRVPTSITSISERFSYLAS
ncbi:MAG: hypothetical protein CMJ64_14975 [Planctomycetaceae bacterium]|nr:hypothetical protein [Planctomycetaceae bacterium]